MTIDPRTDYQRELDRTGRRYGLLVLFIAAAIWYWPAAAWAPLALIGGFMVAVSCMPWSPRR